MPGFSIVTLDEAHGPVVASHRDLLLKEYQEFIDLVLPRRAGKLTPDAGETAQAVRARLGAAARLSKVALTIKRNGDAVYFWKAASQVGSASH